MKKRLVSLLLVGAMLMSVAGTCQAEGTAELDINAPYEETLVLTTGFSERPTVPWPEGDGPTENIYTRAYKERFNIELEPAFVSADWESEYTTKIDFAIVEKNLPDIFRASKQQLTQLVEADMIWDLTEVYEQYASDNIKAIMDAEALSFESGKYDGKLYGIVQPAGSSLAQPESLWLRKDWMEQCGLEAPTSIEDIENIAKTFMEECGASYGIMAEKSLRFLLYMANCWGAHAGIWVENEETGLLEYGTIQPEMKEALATYARWYEEGLLHPDFVTMDFSAQYKEDIINGKAGICPFAVSWGSLYGNDMIATLGKDKYFESYDYPSANGEDVMHPISSSISGYLVVSKECENPEALFKLLNFYDYAQTELSAVEGKELAVEFDYVMHAAEFHRVIDTSGDYAAIERVREAVEARDNSNLVTATDLARYDVITNFLDDPEYFTINAYLLLYEGFDTNMKVFDEERLVYNKMWAEKPQTIVENGTILDDILIEGFTKIIIGEEPIEYFDTVVEEWKYAGGAQATDEANALYSGQ